jgi:UPF0755 protein
VTRDGQDRSPAPRHRARGSGDRGSAVSGGRYGDSDPYGNSDPYGVQDPYGSNDGYAGTDGYSAPEGYGPADGYEAADPYAPSGGYSQDDRGSDGYAEQGYARSDGYAAASGYGSDGYHRPDGYGHSDSYPGQDRYAPESYSRDDTAASRYARDDYEPQDGYAPEDGYGAQRSASADPYVREHPAARPGGYSGGDRFGGDDAGAHDHVPQGSHRADAYDERRSYRLRDPHPQDEEPGARDERYDEPAGYAGLAGRLDADRPPGHDDEDDWAPAGGRDGFIPGLDEDRNGRRGGRRKRRIGRVLAPLIALVMIAAVVVAGYKLYPRFHTPDYAGDGFGQVTVQVQSGATATSLAPELVQLGVVASTRAFVDAAKASSNPTGLEPGFFILHKHMKASLAYALLLNPASRDQTVVTIPEGQRLTQILSTLQQKAGKSVPANGYATAIKDTAALGLPSYADGNPEGYLFPATYDINPGQSPLSVLQAMVARFNQEAQSIDLPAAAQQAQLTPGQVITVASILEAEAGNPKYYAQVAEVIYNRLNMGMDLQVDSTVNYALNRFGVSLTQSQLQVNSPYNTFIHAGLPPGPIDSPGDAAIQAALHPAHGDLLYFVTVNLKTGLTLFTNSPSQFAQFEQECDANNAC